MRVSRVVVLMVIAEDNFATLSTACSQCSTGCIPPPWPDYHCQPLSKPLPGLLHIHHLLLTILALPPTTAPPNSIMFNFLPMLPCHNLPFPAATSPDNTRHTAIHHLLHPSLHFQSTTEPAARLEFPTYDVSVGPTKCSFGANSSFTGRGFHGNTSC